MLHCLLKDRRYPKKEDIVRKVFLMIIVLFVSFSIASCGSSTKEPKVAEKGSLTKTYKLIDNSGLESGTLVIHPTGGAELRDTDGKVIVSFASKATAEPVVEKAAEVPADEKTTDEDKKTE